ncbi:DUF427 domain-containing protein [Aidingimonas halophila]|uniref:Uncharacterized conserved protein, DUF427 family n=1 Tax=Aidingimonas halophila TaxID=574349 RepID=A0A1H2ZVQ6_9GAMM|nr:DUF427 domain-containing protein [Aidingimonas halophila]GHC16787.1 hypothetical protein GCM10008094_02670 [Aidingimonas halophila]SDX21387.1 Uncharacterized conserved protein, DUF427 family [Aidingimonas halophila]
MIHDPTDRIALDPHTRRVQIRAGETLVADTRQAIELRETDYPPRQYLPRDDVSMERLVRSETVTHCPFKGDASYYSIQLDNGEMLFDVAWSYEQPFAAMAAIENRIAFDATRIEEVVGNRA